MKELSIEEKTKAYDGNYKVYKELINRLEDVKEAIKKQNYGIAMDILFKPYPEFQITASTELKESESEDEKVRKALYEYFKNRKDDGDIDETWYGISYDKILAWLEKQGDKVSAIEGFETEFERQVSHLIASAINREHEYNEGYVKWTANALLNFAKHELEKQGEQKPAEVRTTGYWNVQDIEQKPTDKVEPKFKVGDKIYLKPEYRMPDDDTPIANTIFEIRAIDDRHYKFDKSYIFIEDQDKYELVEQKSAEWSEDDQSNFNELSSFILETYRAEDASRLITWLNDIKDRVQLQPKQE
jgi:hypothetical protein